MKEKVYNGCMPASVARFESLFFAAVMAASRHWVSSSLFVAAFLRMKMRRSTLGGVSSPTKT